MKPICASIDEYKKHCDDLRKHMTDKGYEKDMIEEKKFIPKLERAFCIKARNKIIAQYLS